MALPIRRRNSTVDRDRSSAPLVPLEPLSPFEDIYQRMNQMMRAFTSDIDTWPWWSGPVDVEETDEGYIVEVDLPGVSKNDVTVDYRDNQLIIRGEIKEREHTGRLRRRSRRTGSFDYAVTLPGDVDEDKIEASLADGVLTIYAPKAGDARSRRIPINTK
ncbi:MAG TPA: Hsp20/alpha crystallin family protein [Actinopolymorphaceae bacterium]|jgi:HSP20 family protein